MSKVEETNAGFCFTAEQLSKKKRNVIESKKVVQFLPDEIRSLPNLSDLLKKPGWINEWLFYDETKTLFSMKNYYVLSNKNAFINFNNFLTFQKKIVAGGLKCFADRLSDRFLEGYEKSKELMAAIVIEDKQIKFV